MADVQLKKQYSKDASTEFVVQKEKADETDVESVKVETKVEKVETKHSSAKKTVRVLNRTNRVLEFDFGRDKEIRIAPKETAVMDAEYVDHPDVKRELPNIFIYR